MQGKDRFLYLKPVSKVRACKSRGSFIFVERQLRRWKARRFHADLPVYLSARGVATVQSIDMVLIDDHRNVPRGNTGRYLKQPKRIARSRTRTEDQL